MRLRSVAQMGSPAEEPADRRVAGRSPARSPLPSFLADAARASRGINLSEVFGAWRPVAEREPPETPSNDLRAILKASGIDDLEAIPFPAVGMERPCGPPSEPPSCEEGAVLRLVSDEEETAPPVDRDSTSRRRYVVIEMRGGPASLDELQELLEAWPRLSHRLREAIAALVAASV